VGYDEATHTLEVEFKDGTAPAFVDPRRQAILGQSPPPANPTGVLKPMRLETHGLNDDSSHCSWGTFSGQLFRRGKRAWRDQ
jgi:hypothetical protein